MAASHSDSWFLSQDQVFQRRVQQSLVAACIAIGNEGWTVVFHRERANFAQAILTSQSTMTQWVTAFALSVSTDPTCLSDATAAGTVVLTSTNAVTQAALVTDAHIDTAIAAEFNCYIRLPGF